MRNFDYVLFDFDGTVVDTGEGILKSLQYSFSANGEAVPDLSELKKFIGPPVHYSFTHFYGVSEERVGDFIFAYRKRYKEKGIYESKLYSGIRDLLLSLREKNIKIGVASSKPERLIYDVANFLGITELFDAIVGVQTDDSRHSTKSGLILEAMNKLGADDKAKVLMVGDRKFDIDGAKGAGIKSCGVLWGYGDEAEFKEHEAEFIVAEPLDVIDLI